MATLQELMARTRLELSDLKVPFYERIVTSGDSSRYDLKGISNIEGDFFLYPLGNPGAALTEGTDFTLQRSAGLIVFSTVPTAGTVYIAEGEYGEYFSDSEIETFVRTAFDMHTRNRNPRIGYDSLPAHEVLLVAILAQIEALWVLKAASAYEINVHAPEGMFIPRGQRFEQLNRFLMEVEARYKELSNAMGVGLYALEMFTLRRVSRSTGRYVPIYLDREYDDTRPPQRVFPNISAQGAELPEPTIVKENIQVTHGRPFEKIFEITEDDLPLVLDTTRDVIEAHLLRTPYTAHLHRNVLPEFTVTIGAPATHEVTIALTDEETSQLESTGSYQWTFSWQRDGVEVYRVEGELLVESGLPLKSVNVRFS